MTSFTLTNHPSEIDFMLSTVLFTKRFSRASSFRFFIKDDIKYVPGFGWMLWLNEQIFLKRSYEKDEEKIRKSLGKLSKLPKGFVLTLFPEGRIFSQKRLDECIKSAKEENREFFKNLLIPKWRGFATCINHLKSLPGRSEILVQKMTIAYENNLQPTYGGILNGESTVAHVLINLVELNQVEASKESLYELYREKDAALDDFKRFNTFKGENLKSFKLEKSNYALMNFIFWWSICLIISMLFIFLGFWKALITAYLILYAMCK